MLFRSRNYITRNTSILRIRRNQMSRRNRPGRKNPHHLPGIRREAEEMAGVEAAPRIRLRRRLRIRLLSLLSRQLRNRSFRNSRSSRNIRQSYRIPIIRTARTRLPSWSMVCRRLILNIGIRSLRNTCTFWRIRFLWHTGCPTRGRIHRDCYGLRCAESPWLV